MITKRQLGWFIVLIGTSLTFGQDIERIGETVVGIEVYKPVFENVDTNKFQVFYKNAAGTMLEKRQTGQGTGFFLRHGAHTYIVTAAHVPAGSSDGKLLLITTNGTRVSLPLETIRKAFPGAKWFYHPIADVALHPYFKTSDLDIRNLDITEDYLRTNSLPLLEPTAAVGFPRGVVSEEFHGGLGVIDHLSPVAMECKLASWFTELSDFPNYPKLKYILLDKPLVQGYSGAPIFTQPIESRIIR